MILPDIIRSPVHALDNRRPRFFSKYEWRYHLLMMPLLFPLGNYYFIGSQYFTDYQLFWIGTALVFFLYWLSISLLTLLTRWATRLYPAISQTVPRTLVMAFLIGGLTIGLSIFDVWIYSLIPATRVQLSWSTIQPIWILGLVFDIFLCLALSLFYTYSQWKEDLTESELLQRMALQRQYDNLKGQLNPHFLFNSLNSLSVLISEEPKLAEQFVDKLARVYRYMLQSSRPENIEFIDGQNELVTLQEELDFICLYTDLLQVRYGNSLRIQIPPLAQPAYGLRTLLPLTLLTLVENAIKHNSMSAKNPLVIRIDITDEGMLRVTNNRQKKTLRMITRQAGLSSLKAKYRQVLHQYVVVESADEQFSVLLPLLSVNKLSTKH